MKLRLLLLCLICSLSGQPAHAESSPPLSVRVIVTLREQADLSRIQDGDPSLRRRQIVAALKATAASGAQSKAGAIAIRAAVDEPVTDITPFWIFNGFAITASPERHCAACRFSRCAACHIRRCGDCTGRALSLPTADVEAESCYRQCPRPVESRLARARHRRRQP